MKRYFLAAAVLAALCAGAHAQEEMRAFFPGPQEVAGWSVSYDIEMYPGDKIYDFIDGAGEVFMRYNFDVAAAAEYAGPNEGAIAVEIYKMKTPEDAYGIYAYHEPKGAEALDVAQAGYASGITAAVWRNLYYVKIYGLEDKPGMAEAVREFAKMISGKIPGQGNLPQLFRVFEVNGFKKGSVKFLRSDLALKNLHFVSEENVLHLGEGTEMAFASYSIRGRDFEAFVIIYPSDQESARAATDYALFLGKDANAEATWYKQSGRAIVGTWTGLKVGETHDIQDVLFDTMKNILEQLKAYQLHR